MMFNSLALVEQTIGGLFDQLRKAPQDNIDESSDFISPAIAMIDREVAAYTLILRSVQQRISACQTRRNVLAPINQLSQDVIHVIFDLTVKEWKASTTYYNNLFSLRLVCKAWDAFIRDRGSFWALAFPALQEELHGITIPRSLGHPLEIRYPGSSRGRGRGRGASYDTRRSRCDRFISRVVAEGWPVKTLDFDETTQPPPQASIRALLVSPAPLLETVRLDLCHSLDNLFGGTAPLLRRAVFKRLVLYQHAPGMPNLRSLELHRVRGLDLQRLLHILALSPELEKVIVKTLESLSSLLPLEVAVAPIALLHLRSLRLSDIPSALATGIVHAISTPETTRISVQTVYDPESPLNVDPNFSHLVHTLTRKYPTDNIQIAYRLSQTFILKARGWKLCSYPTRYNWNTEPTDATTHCTYFLHMIPTSARAIVHSLQFVGQERINPLLRALNIVFPSLRTLSFELQQYGGAFAIDALTDTIGTGPGLHRWLCPELRRLTFEQSTLDLPSLAAVVAAVEERSQNNVAGVLPCPLDSFTWKVGGVVDDSPLGVTLVERLRRVVTEVRIEEREPSDYRWPETGGWDSDADASDDGVE